MDADCMDHMKFIVYRQEKFWPANFVVVTAVVNKTVIKTVADLVAALKKGVTKCTSETEEGKTLYKYAGSDMNIGDLISGMSDMPSFLLNYCENVIFGLEFEQIDVTDDWMYDTSLCNAKCVDVNNNPYDSSLLYYQPKFDGELIDRYGNQHGSYVVWLNKETCQSLFPASEILTFTGDDIQEPEFFDKENEADHEDLRRNDALGLND